MAEVRSKLVFDIESNARQTFQEFSSGAQRATAATKGVERELQAMGRIEKELVRINNRAVQQRIAQYKKEEAAIRRRNRAARGGKGGIGAGFKIGRAGAVISAVGAVAASAGGEGEGFGAQAGRVAGQVGGGAATGALIGSFAGPVGTAVGAGLGAAVGAIKGLTSEIARSNEREKTKADEAADKQRVAAEKLAEAARKLERLEGILVRTTESSVRTAVQAAIEIQRGGTGGFAAGDFGDVLAAIRADITNREEQRQQQADLIAAMKEFVAQGLVTREQADTFLAARGVSAKPDSDSLAVGTTYSLESALGING